MSWSHTLGAYLRTRPTSPPSTMTSLLWDTVIINVTEVDLMVVILQERREGKSSGWSETVGGPTGERTDISGDCEDRDFIFECENEMLTRLARGINNIGIESGACDWAMPKDTWSNVTFPPEVGPVIILIITTHTWNGGELKRSPCISVVTVINKYSQQSLTGADQWQRRAAGGDCLGFDSGVESPPHYHWPWRHNQSCIMSQIWQIYLCKNIKRLG